MRVVFAVLALMGLLVAGTPLVMGHAHADTTARPASLPNHVLGDPKAPITVQEFVSLTCPHCADYYLNVLPKLKEKYIDTGKVRFILRDFPRDGADLKAFTLAQCMPEEEFFPFVEVLFKNQMSWATLPDPEKTLIQYAQLGGLGTDKAKACIKDTKLQDALVAGRDEAEKKYNIQATPSFVINEGAEKVDMPTAEKFSAVFDKLLAAKK